MDKKTKQKHDLVICVQNTDNEASLELRKIYEVLPDPTAARHGQVRVIDESGEDYLFPSDFFVTVTLPDETEQAVINAA